MNFCASNFFRISLFAIAAFLTPSALHAQSWSGGGGSGAWLTTTNWTGGVPAGNATVTTNTDTAVFNVATQPTVGINMGTTSGVYYLGAIDYTNSTARNLNNSSSTVGGILTLNGATVNSVANTIIRNSSTGLLTITNGTGSGTLGLGLGNPTTNVIQITNNGGITINSVISGGGGITKQGTGSGVLILAGNNNYTGVTAIGNGTVSISNANALGSTASGSHTTIAANGSTTGGRLQLNSINTPENITLNGATESSGFNPVLFGSGTFSGNITLAGTNGIRIGSGTTIFSGNITQTGTSHALVFQGTNTVSNPIAINGGALVVYQGTTTLNGVSGTGIGSTTVDQAGGLRLGVTDAINTGADLSFGNNAMGTNEFNLASFNQTVRGLSSSGTTVTKRVFNSVVSTNSTLTVGNGGGDYAFNGTILNNTGTGGTVALIKTGAGNQTLSGVNTYTGGTRIDSGILTLGNATNTLANTGAINVNGGTLALGANSDTVGAVTLTNGSITSSTGVLTGASYGVESGTVSAILGGSGIALTKTTGGTVTLTGNNTYTGATSVNAGTLAVSGNGSINGSSGVTLNGGKLEYNSSVAMTAPLTFTSGTLGGTNWTGSTLNNLVIDTNRTISPGNSPGTASTVDQTWAGGGNYTWEINNGNGTVGTDPGWDLLSGTGNLTITANSGTPFNILVTSLTLGNVSGNATNFDDTQNYTWQIADFANPVSGFDVSDFLVNTSAFTNTFTGNFSVALGGTGSVPGDNTQVYVTYVAVPEPKTMAILGAGVALLGLRLARRKRD